MGVKLEKLQLLPDAHVGLGSADLTFHPFPPTSHQASCSSSLHRSSPPRSVWWAVAQLASIPPSTC